MTRAARVLLLAAAVAALPACLDVSGPGGFVCETQAPTKTGQVQDTTLTNIGLRYVENASMVGTGTELPACQIATIHFRARLAGQTANFDSTYGGQPISFVAGGGELRVVGLDVGVIGMKAGGRRTLIVPPSLAYGSVEQVDRDGNVVVPANSTLIFDVQLISVEIRDND